MDKKKSQTQKEKERIVQSRLNQSYYDRLQAIPGKTNSEKIRSLIDGNYYLNSSEITTALVELKDALHEAERTSDISYLRIKKAGNDICRLLSTN